RLFSAIPFPEHLKDKVRELTRGRLPVPYVNVTNLHVTINFFGDLETDQTKRLIQIFPEALNNKATFKLYFDQITKFHHQIHMTLKDNPQLIALQAEMHKYFDKHGFGLQDRAFYPHVKLANLHMDKVMHRERKIENFPNNELSQLDFVAEKVVLYESKLLLHHAHHKPVAEIALT
ncbi:MAG TPA: RNA 2',3'-cyclic phosphodiesterase, partial [Verrucomicrobiae bacterium]|nr:RNA 2',3'-cyclic phosphodiesterase [Verrucomicrobiae bacterium]